MILTGSPGDMDVVVVAMDGNAPRPTTWRTTTQLPTMRRRGRIETWQSS
jgi:hypothetical protein